MSDFWSKSFMILDASPSLKPNLRPLLAHAASS